MHSNIVQKEKAFLMGAYFDESKAKKSLAELNRLAESAMLEVVGSDYQMLKEINAYSYIGMGKLEILKEKIDALNCDTVIFDVNLTGSQLRNISEVLKVKVLDRTMLILDIFASRAQSSEGKLQVELAQMKYTLPRLSYISGTSGRFGAGGVGMRGPGETKIETDRRKIKDAIFRKEKELKQVKMHRSTTKKQRKENVKTVALIGYTNSGKTTLLNTMAKAEGYADDRLFATLDVLSKKVWDDGISYVLSDTVGFVTDLPHDLTHAFSATLEEAADADLLLIVVDASDENKYDQLNVVLDVLAGLNRQNASKILVYNKVDLLTVEAKAELENLNDGIDKILISAKNNINIELLKQMIKSRLNK